MRHTGGHWLYRLVGWTSNFNCWRHRSVDTFLLLAQFKLGWGIGHLNRFGDSFLVLLRAIFKRILPLYMHQSYLFNRLNSLFWRHSGCLDSSLIWLKILGKILLGQMWIALALDEGRVLILLSLLFWDSCYFLTVFRWHFNRYFLFLSNYIRSIFGLHLLFAPLILRVAKWTRLIVALIRHVNTSLELAGQARLDALTAGQLLRSLILSQIVAFTVHTAIFLLLVPFSDGTVPFVVFLLW